jgi:hypothetical protein
MSVWDESVQELIDYNEEQEEVEVGYVAMVDRGSRVIKECGITANSITMDQIEALKKGKCIYFSDGEYAHVVYLKR